MRGEIVVYSERIPINDLLLFGYVMEGYIARVECAVFWVQEAKQSFSAIITCN